MSWPEYRPVSPYVGCKPMKSKENTLNLSAKAVHERFSRWPESRTGALWLCRPTKTFTMWRQAEGVSRPSQRSIAPGGFLRLESDVNNKVCGRLIGFRAANPD